MSSPSSERPVIIHLYQSIFPNSSDILGISQKSGISYGIPCQHIDPASRNNIWIIQGNNAGDEDLPLYTHPLGRNGQNISDDDKTVWRKDVAETVEKAVDDFSAELRELSLDIHGEYVCRLNVSLIFHTARRPSRTRI